MKLLVLMSILQTAALAFLLAKALDSPDPASQTAPAMQYQDTGETFSSADEQLLRRIVREELGRQLPGAAPAGQPDQAPAGAPTDAAADQRSQLQLVETQLEYYRVQGAISAVEMQNLQAEIAKLDPATRKQMLARLVKAMNAGEIRGAL